MWYLMINHKVWRLHLVMTTFLLGLPCPDPTASTFFTTSLPAETLPKTTCLPSSQEVSAVVMKNWLPLVLGPALAMERQKGSCFSLKFSSLKLLPQIDSPPVPSPRVKSPPWIIKLGIILWNELPSYFEELQRVAKFSTVLGTVFPKRSITISPAALPPISMEKVTLWVTVSWINLEIQCSILRRQLPPGAAG